MVERWRPAADELAIDIRYYLLLACSSSLVEVVVERLGIVPNGSEPDKRGIYSGVRGTELGVGLLCVEP